jgi:hypothetical protein
LSQSSTIAFFLLIGFIAFVTLRGELVQYAQAVGLVKGASSA